MIGEPVHTRSQAFDEMSGQRPAREGVRLSREQTLLLLQAKRDAYRMVNYGITNTAFSDKINANNIIGARQQKEIEAKERPANGHSPRQDKSDDIKRIQVRSDYWLWFMYALAGLRVGLEQAKQERVKKEERVELHPKDANKQLNEARNNPNYDGRKNPLLDAARKQRKSVKSMMNSRELSPKEKELRFNMLTGRISYNDLYHMIYDKPMKLRARSMQPRAEKFEKELTPLQRKIMRRKRMERLQRLKGVE